jgi:hypothetical protein
MTVGTLAPNEKDLYKSSTSFGNWRRGAAISSAPISRRC